MEENQYGRTYIGNITFNADYKQINELIQHTPKIKQWDAKELCMGTYVINIGNL